MISPKEIAWDDRLSLVASSVSGGKLGEAAAIAQRMVEEAFAGMDALTVARMEEVLGFMDGVVRLLVSQRAWEQVDSLLSGVLAHLPESVRDDDRAYLEYHAGVAAVMLKDFSRARSLLQGARTAAEMAGDPELASLVLRVLGQADFEEGRLDEASELTELAWTINPVATALCHLGLINLAAGDYAAAHKAYEECVARFGGLPLASQEELTSRLYALEAAGVGKAELAFFHGLLSGSGLRAQGESPGATPAGTG